MGEIATTARPKSVLMDMADRFAMDPAAFEATLRATVVPKDCNKEQFAAFLMVARDYGLNPVLKEIFAFPAKGGGIQPIVSIDGWLTMINRHPHFDGLEFEDVREGGTLVAIEAKIYRNDRTKPTTVIEYMSECRRETDTWKKWPARMLRHKAAIQCARYAFGFSGLMEPDEYDRMVEVNPVPPPPRREDFTKSRIEAEQTAHTIRVLDADGEESGWYRPERAASMIAGMIRDADAATVVAVVEHNEEALTEIGGLNLSVDDIMEAYRAAKADTPATAETAGADEIKFDDGAYPTFARAFVAAMQNAASNDEVDDWQLANMSALDACQADAPKAYAAITKAIQVAKERVRAEPQTIEAEDIGNPSKIMGGPANG